MHYQAAVKVFQIANIFTIVCSVHMMSLLQSAKCGEILSTCFVVQSTTGKHH